MSYFKTCEDCAKEINSYDYIFCDECLKKHLKCQDCSVQITKKQDEESLGNCLCKGCFKIAQIIDNGYRWEKSPITILKRFEEKALEQFKHKSDDELENAWQSSANMIGMYIQKSWSCTPEDEQKWRDEAIKMQDRQSLIQLEITRRAK